MILGMTALTFVHVVISLIGILSGFVVVFGLLTARRLDGWTAVFLSTTIATSATGFLSFPFHKFLPSHAVGILSLLVLSLAVFARYARHLAGAWTRHLRYRRRVRFIHECFRAHRAVIPEGSGVERARSHPNRDAV